MSHAREEAPHLDYDPFEDRGYGDDDDYTPHPVHASSSSSSSSALTSRYDEHSTPVRGQRLQEETAVKMEIESDESRETATPVSSRSSAGGERGKARTLALPTEEELEDESDGL